MSWAPFLLVFVVKGIGWFFLGPGRDGGSSASPESSFICHLRLWGKRGDEKLELNLPIGSRWHLKENTLILSNPGKKNQELLWDREKQFFKNLEFYWSWRSSMLAQLRFKLLELWFICHWYLKSNVLWIARRIKISWRVGIIVWLEIEVSEIVF